MMMFWKAKLIMLSTPKTGTHAYQAALGAKADVIFKHPPNLKHVRAQRLKRKVLPALAPQDSDTYEIMAVIRDPLDWIGSWYRYRCRPQIDGRPESVKHMSFDEFVTEYLSDSSNRRVQIGSQANFVSNDSGRILVDHLFAYERPGLLRTFLSERLKTDIPAPPEKNVSPKMKLKLDPNLEDRLREERADDFALHAGLMLH